MDLVFSVFSDLHANNFRRFAQTGSGGINSRLLDAIGVLDQISAYNEANKISTSFFLGDLFHSFSFVENDVMNMVVEAMERWYGKLYYIHGNHDLRVKAGVGKVFSGSAVLEKLGRFRHVYLDDGQAMELDGGVMVRGLGWRKPEDFLWITSGWHTSATILLAHQLIENDFIPGGLLVPQNVLKLHDLCIFGDMHRPLDFGNVLVPGAPMQHNFGDEGQDRGFWVIQISGVNVGHGFSVSGIKKTFIPLKAPKFITVKSVGDIKQDGNFYRITDEVPAGTVLPDNVVAAPERKAEFRETKMDPEASDDIILREYVTLTAPENSEENKNKLVEFGKSVLSAFESKALAPKGWRVDEVGIKNFMSFQGEHVIPFRPGVRLVAGDNGVGKTTMFEAVFWGLYGETTKGVGADEVINDDVGSGCAVQVLLLGSNNTRLLVNRERKSNSLSYTIFGADDKRTKFCRESMDATQQDLNKVLGADASMFKNFCYFSQEDFEFFSSMSDAGQKALCKSLRKIDRFESAELAVKDINSKVSAVADNIKTSISWTESSLVEKEHEMEDFGRRAAEWEATKVVELTRYSEQHLEAQKRAISAKKTLDVLDSELTVLEEERQKLKRPVVFNIDAALLDAEKIAQELLDNHLVEVEEAQRSPVLKKVADVELELKYDIRKHESDVLALGMDIEKTKASLEKLRSGICPIGLGDCDRVVNKTFVRNAGLELEKLFEQKSELEKVGLGFEQRRLDLAELVKRGQEITDFIQKGLLSLSSLRADVKQAQFAVENKKAELLSAFDAEVKSLSDDIRNMEAKRRELSVAHAAALGDISAIDEKVQSLNLAKNVAVELLETATAAVFDLKGKLVALKKEQEKCADDIALSSFWAKGFSNQGIVSYLLDGFAKSFTGFVNEALFELTGGRYAAELSTQKKLRSGEWREKFEFKVFVDGRERSYKALSGGQKARINFATVMALGSIVEKQTGGRPFGFVVLDELVTDLDSEGTESVYGLLEKLAGGGSAYVVTHVDSFKSLFPDVLRVWFDKNRRTTVVED